MHNVYIKHIVKTVELYGHGRGQNAVGKPAKYVNCVLSPLPLLVVFVSWPVFDTICN